MRKLRTLVAVGVVWALLGHSIGAILGIVGCVLADVVGLSGISIEVAITIGAVIGAVMLATVAVSFTLGELAEREGGDKVVSS